MSSATSCLAAALVALSLHSAAAAAFAGAKVERAAPDRLALSWTSPDPVDVYESAAPDATPAQARLVAHAVRAGGFALDHADLERRYFILVDERDHAAVRVAERLVPLAQGSNFRDVGGYPAADGRHVRWGLIFRSGAQPLLTAADLAQLRAIGLAQIVDLRSKEERVLAPTAIDGVPYSAVGYSMVELFKRAGSQPHNGVEIYRGFPTMLAPQMKILFEDLLSRRAPVVYNCSAGQDRTGFATAMILSALGVPRQVIYADYMLCTADRRPEYEMPRVDLAAHPNDPAAQLLAHYHDNPEARRPQPLADAAGRPFLVGAFEEIDAKWGSVDGYLRQEIGLTDADIATLRRLYLE
jgi:protein-tyrosine phosphatase